MKVDFDCNYITNWGYYVILTSRRGNTFFGYVLENQHSRKIIDQCNWDSNGKELRGRAQHDLKEVAPE